MDTNELIKKMNDNLLMLEDVNKEISMIELAIYQKSIEKIKSQKINETRDFLEKQAINYGQKYEKYQNQISSNMEKYVKKLEAVVNAYDNLYLNTFKIMENARNNQKVSVANIIILEEKINKTENIKEKQNLQNMVIACAQKKLNYSVITDECDARIMWCIENVQKDINEIFMNNYNKIEIYKTNDIVKKIRKFFFNKISGKKRYADFLSNYENEYMKEISTKCNSKIFEIIATSKGVTLQMENVKKQISTKYNQMVNV